MTWIWNSSSHFRNFALSFATGSFAKFKTEFSVDLKAALNYWSLALSSSVSCFLAANKNPCIPNPCRNNGTCSKGPDQSFDCTCSKGYFPPLCTSKFKMLCFYRNCDWLKRQLYGLTHDFITLFPKVRAFYAERTRKLRTTKYKLIKQ